MKNNYTAKELASFLEAKVVGDSNRKISDIFYDSRNIVCPKEGVFFALSGIHDGHNFIEEAYTKSIRIFVCSYIPNIHQDATYILVEEPIDALQKWAKFHLSKYPLKTLGITGSNGKTIIKEWLNQCLNTQFSIFRSPKSFNSQLGLALSVLQINSEYDLGIFEVGISLPGEMEKQEKILLPKIGILTNILEAHSANFKNREEQIKEKIKLFKHSELLILPDDVEIKKIVKQNYPSVKKVFFGEEKGSDIQLLSKFKQKESTCLNVKIKNKEDSFIIPFSDEASIQNALCLIAVLTELNVDTFLIKEKLFRLSPILMRLELINGENNCIIINDTFNSDIKSLEIALHQLFQQNKPQKILVLSDILQSSAQEKVLYYQVANLVNAFPLDCLFLVGENILKYSHLFKVKLECFTSTEEVLHCLKKSLLKDSAILLKGARNFGLERLSHSLQLQSHDTILEVNLHSLMMNVNFFKSLLRPQTKMIGMVKASSYGIGSFEVAEILQYHHIDYLAVAYPDEGALLRKKGIYIPIMVMNPEINSYDMVIDNYLEPEIYSFRVLEKFSIKLKEKLFDKKYPIHIKIDTGMHRLGFNSEDAEKLAVLLKNNPLLEVKSVFTHLAVSDVPEEKEFINKQVSLLTASYEKIVNVIEYKPLLHCCNSTGIINYPEYQFDAVRLGIGMYGYIDHEQALKKLENVITLKTVISDIHTIEKEETVGYGRKFIAKRKSRIATLPIGYADGIRRLVGNGNGYVRINGKVAPIIGSVCMDMMMIDVTDIACKEGDSVIVMGESPSLKEYAMWSQTIPYEILTSISPRVKRIFYKE